VTRKQGGEHEWHRAALPATLRHQQSDLVYSDSLFQVGQKVTAFSTTPTQRHINCKTPDIYKPPTV